MERQGGGMIAAIRQAVFSGFIGSIGFIGCAGIDRTPIEKFRVCQYVIDFVGDILAERVGFEPTVGLAYTRFPSVRLKPLGHLSGAPARSSV
jgi:hypothetical protein